MSLPTEIWQHILQERFLRPSDITRLRLVNHRLKDVADSTYCSRFRLPAISIGTQQPVFPSTMATYARVLQASQKRMVTGHYERIQLFTGVNSMLMAPSFPAFLLRCGNGRLLAANLYSPSRSLFEEVLPLDSMSNAENLAAVAPPMRQKQPWRILTRCHEDQLCRLYWHQESTTVRLQLAASDPPHTGELAPRYPRQYLFSSDGQFVVERSRQFTRRYAIGDNPPSVDCVASIATRRSVTLCAQTGRRFKYVAGKTSRLRIFADAISQHVDFEMSTPAPLGELLAVSVSPDGKSVALATRVQEDDGDFGWIEFWPLYTFDVSAQQGEPVDWKIIHGLAAGMPDDHQYERDGTWLQTASKQWCFLRRKRVQTKALDSCTDWNLGIQDNHQMVTLTSSRHTPDKLWLLTALAPNTPSRPEPNPTSWQRFRYRMDQSVLSLEPPGVVVALAALAGAGLGVILLVYGFQPTVKMKSVCAAMGIASAMVLLAASRNLYLQSICRTLRESRATEVIDLQRIELPAAA